ncbi:hypothetical protein [Yersinia pseudotuberculosis]|uniref:hypothetical protein n=1 Tax=Yersinia pseudotuberculosis TaxID=633 RepID=UPI0005DFDEC5|nr:hypothetical protein [Yersinia pseudotuberculosis]CFR00952.1 phage-like protein [Yersinia pseudotuberculosis]
MNEKPILFNSEMVQAILSGRKTQTRRIMKVQPEPSKSRSGDYWFPCNKMQSMVHVSDLLPGNPYMPDAHEFFSTCCPLGGIGDQLWVRETFALLGNEDGVCVDWQDNMVKGDEQAAARIYKASCEQKHGDYGLYSIPDSAYWKPDTTNMKYEGTWRPSIHMPRWASRIDLLITGVRVERLQSITLGDICKEVGCGLYDFFPATDGFRVWTELWDSIYGQKEGENWQANPWVWVINFERMEAK